MPRSLAPHGYSRPCVLSSCSVASPAPAAWQVDVYAAEQKLSIVGYYHANERRDDEELGAVARRIADKIHSYVPAACVLLVRPQLVLPASSTAAPRAPC